MRTENHPVNIIIPLLGSQVLTVAGDSLSYEAYTADGRLFDAFEIRKTDLRGPGL